MGYRGKVVEREQARELRADGMILSDIAAQLGVSKGSVSGWVRDVEFTPSKRRYGPRVRPNALMQRKADEIEATLEAGRTLVGSLSEREFLMAGAALYAGEGAKGDGRVCFANSDPRMIVMFLSGSGTSSISMGRGCESGLSPRRSRSRNCLHVLGRSHADPGRAAPSAVPRQGRCHHAADKARVGLPQRDLCRFSRPSPGHGNRACLANLRPPSGVAQLAERLTVNQ